MSARRNNLIAQFHFEVFPSAIKPLNSRSTWTILKTNQTEDLSSPGNRVSVQPVVQLTGSRSLALDSDSGSIGARI